MCRGASNKLLGLLRSIASERGLSRLALLALPPPPALLVLRLRPIGGVPVPVPPCWGQRKEEEEKGVSGVKGNE